MGFFSGVQSFIYLIGFKIQIGQGYKVTEKSDTLEKFSMTKFQNARQKDASFSTLNYLLNESLLFGRFTPAREMANKLQYTGKWETLTDARMPDERCT